MLLTTSYSLAHLTSPHSCLLLAFACKVFWFTAVSAPRKEPAQTTPHAYTLLTSTRCDVMQDLRNRALALTLQVWHKQLGRACLRCRPCPKGWPPSRIWSDTPGPPQALVANQICLQQLLTPWQALAVQQRCLPHQPHSQGLCFLPHRMLAHPTLLQHRTQARLC